MALEWVVLIYAAANRSDNGDSYHFFSSLGFFACVMLIFTKKTTSLQALQSTLCFGGLVCIICCESSDSFNALLHSILGCVIVAAAVVARGSVRCLSFTSQGVIAL